MLRVGAIRSVWTRWLTGFALCWMFAAVGVATPAWAQALVSVPPLTARVMDQTGRLAVADVAALEQQLMAFEQQRGTQIVVLLVPSTAPEDIADFTQRLGDAWKIGRPEVGDGLLLVVALNDRRLRIAPAKALEGAVPDLAAKRIIDQVITPAFRQGDVAGGLRAGLNHLQARIEGEALPLPEPGTQRSQKVGVVGADWLDLAVLFIFAVPLVAAVLRRVLGQRLGALAAGAAAGVLAWIMTGLLWLGVMAALLGLLTALFMQALPSAAVRRSQGRVGRGGPGGFPGWDEDGRGGHGGWGGSGGGFSSGGGGNFGGGGASGSW